LTVFASTACLVEPRGLWGIVELYRGAGLGAVELGSCVLDPDDALDLVPRLRSLGLDLVVHNYFPPPADSFVLNMASRNDEIAQRSLDFVLDALTLSAELGAPFYSVHAGFLTDPIGFDGTSFILPAPASERDAAVALERFVAALRRALERADSLGLELLVETSVCTDELRGKLLLLTSDEWDALFRELPSPSLGVLLDTGHLNVTAQTLGLDRLAFVDAIAPRVRAFHVHDNLGSSDEHLPVESGSWVHGVLLRESFAGLPVTVEAKFATVSGLSEHVAWLEGELAREATPR
jgi:sugar phosphate isomerase/epimerase